MNSISVVIPTYKRNILLREIVTTLLAQKKHIGEILIIDNDPQYSAKPICSFTKEITIRYFINNKNGACGSRNLGIKKAQSSIIALLDDDTIPQENWAYSIIDFFNHRKNEKSILMGKNLNGLDNSVIAGVEYFQTELTYRSNYIRLNKEVLSLALDSKNCAFLRKHILDDSLFFDTRFGRVTSFEDIDFGIRARQKGYKIYFNHKVVAVHKGRTTLITYIKRELQKMEGLRIFSTKWKINTHKVQELYKLAWESENIDPFHKVKMQIEKEVFTNKSLLYIMFFYTVVKSIDLVRKIYSYDNFYQNG